jgi:methionyl-tRNA formyltransferase
MTLALFLMTEKGHAALQAIVSGVPPGAVGMVVGSRDANVHDDHYEDIQGICKQAGIAFFDRASVPAITAEYALAISWRWMIKGVPNLITLHDSLLPKYRGFAPLPNSLINGETEIGVSALFASDDYDTGDVICQKRVPIRYPIKVQEAIQSIIPLYVAIAGEICSSLAAGGRLPRYRQDESQASYSLWRDDLDYAIDWSWDADRVKRFIDAVGYPYLGAKTLLNQAPVTVLDAVVEADVRIENRTAGKVIFVRDGQPVVVCGRGLLRITHMTAADGDPLLPLKKFRSRFGSCHL